MKKKTLTKKLALKVKNVSVLSDSASAAIKGGLTSPRCSDGTCITCKPKQCNSDLCR
ncbi:MAG: class I lanthipeptide [Pseudobacter sp.]|uniref:class I lanthipeptide n=1 Tax=Pseudobacter sp. TaxID=2045420 RepID=UPI003F7FC426